MAAYVIRLPSAVTVPGSFMTFGATNGAVEIGNAMVIQADIATKIVGHAICAVVLTQ